MLVPLRGNRHLKPSMKVPPKRKGNLANIRHALVLSPLNESPSEKEGKFRTRCMGG